MAYYHNPYGGTHPSSSYHPSYSMPMPPPTHNQHQPQPRQQQQQYRRPQQQSSYYYNSSQYASPNVQKHQRQQSQMGSTPPLSPMSPMMSGASSAASSSSSSSLPSPVSSMGRMPQTPSYGGGMMYGGRSSAGYGNYNGTGPGMSGMGRNNQGNLGLLAEVSSHMDQSTSSKRHRVPANPYDQYAKPSTTKKRAKVKMTSTTTSLSSMPGSSAFPPSAMGSAAPPSAYGVAPSSSTGGRKTQREKAFSCEKCGARFTERYNLNKHERVVHNRERPYKCKICQARFQQKDHMTKHVNCVHLKKRPFKCDVPGCGASFGWRGVLVKHRSSVHHLKS